MIATVNPVVVFALIIISGAALYAAWNVVQMVRGK